MHQRGESTDHKSGCPHIILRWKAKYGGLGVAEVRRLRQLEDENGRLKRLVADLTLHNQPLKGLLAKTF